MRELDSFSTDSAPFDIAWPNRSIQKFKDITDLTTTDSYFQPTQKNFGAIDAFIKPNIFLQITVSKKHPINYPTLLQVLNVTKVPDPKYIFVVPEDVFAVLTKQSYTNSNGNVLSGNYIDNKVKAVTQYALCLPID